MKKYSNPDNEIIIPTKTPANVPPNVNIFVFKAKQKTNAVINNFYNIYFLFIN